MDVDTGGQVLITGYLGGMYAWSRISNSGTLDLTVGPTTSPGRAPVIIQPQTIVSDSSGRVLVGGIRYASGGEGQNFAVQRFTSNGSIDATFGVGGVDGNGIVSTDFQGSTADLVYELSQTQPDGKLVIAGYKSGAPRNWFFPA